MKQKEELEDSVQQELNMNMLPILMMMNTTTHLLQQQSMNNTIHHPLPSQPQEEKKDTIDATEYTAPEAYVPKHAKKEDLEKEQVSI